MSMKDMMEKMTGRMVEDALNNGHLAAQMVQETEGLHVQFVAVALTRMKLNGASEEEIKEYSDACLSDYQKNVQRCYEVMLMSTKKIPISEYHNAKDEEVDDEREPSVNEKTAKAIMDQIDGASGEE